MSVKKHRRAPRVDANQGEIIAALRDHGASVESLAGQHKGCPDLLVGWKGKNYLMEVKDGSRPPSGRKLTEMQVVWHSVWEGQVDVVASVDEALELLKR